jgi:hypothetical protein
MPRRGAYAALGAAIATGAPLGLVLTRAWRRGVAGWASVAADLRGEAATYVYVALSTILVFAAFGYVLGVQADRLLERSQRDPLTGLANWRVLQERLRQELARVHRCHSSCSTSTA